MVVLVYNLSTQEEERGGLWVVGQSELYNKTLSQKKIKRKGGREEEREKERREGEEKGRKGVWREGGRERKKEKKERKFTSTSGNSLASVLVSWSHGYRYCQTDSEQQWTWSKSCSTTARDCKQFIPDCITFFSSLENT
jgi:hypothetical protein